MAKQVKAAPKAKADTSARKLSRSELNALIEKIGKTAKDIQSDVHKCMARIVIHALRFEDVDHARKLIEAFGEKGKTVFRTNMLRDWFITNGPMRWDDESKNFKLDRKKFADGQKHIASDRTTAAYLTKLMNVTPWAAKAEPEYKGFSFMKQINAAIRLAQKAEKEHGKHPKTDVKHLDAVRAFVASLEEKGTGDNDNDDTITDVANVA